MSGRAVRIMAVLVALVVLGGGGFAQEPTLTDEEFRRTFEKLQQQDRQAREDGFVLDRFQVRPPPDDPRPRSMQLSIGRTDGRPGTSAFDERPSNFLLDPLAPPEAPPVGLNLKLQF